MRTSEYIRESDSTIIIANEASLIDYAYLASLCQPMFVAVDIIDEHKLGLRAMGRFEIISRAMGIKLPQ